MAERRMFAKTIVDSDVFLDMPLSTQALYFHLSMRADDEGFINNAKKIQRMIGATEDDLKELVAKNFIILFDSGIVVIKHWRIHNYIQSDRYKPTVYTEEKQALGIKQNKAYTLLDAGSTNDGAADTTEPTNTQCDFYEEQMDKVKPVPKSKDPDVYLNEIVHMSQRKHDNLIADFGEDVVEDYAERLMLYIQRKGYDDSHDHSATIRSWLRNDGGKSTKQKQKETEQQEKAKEPDAVDKTLAYLDEIGF